MPLIQQSAAIAAGAVVENVLAGSQYEFLPYHARIDIAINGSAAGLVADAYSGQDVLVERMQVGAQNRFPVMPDDFTLSDIAAAGERLKVRVENPTGGALTHFTAVRITPIGR